MNPRRMTANQHLILADVDEADVPAMKQLLAKNKLDNLGDCHPLCAWHSQLAALAWPSQNGSVLCSLIRLDVC